MSTATEHHHPEELTLWHSRLDADAVAALGGKAGGLCSAEAIARLSHGPNGLPGACGDGALRLLWRHIHNAMIWVLLGTGSLAIMLGKALDGFAVLGVVVASAALGFLQLRPR